MAYTKVFPIRQRLDKSVAYAVNEKKTDLADRIEYAVNRSKTEKRLMESALNCQSPQTAYEEMQETKRRWHKTDGVLGYHFIQSFAPGEVTAEEAHALGVAFADRLFGDRFEVVIGTHLDKAHLHNHIVINAVSFMDGLKYHSSPESYYNTIRTVSDDLCREKGLSVIDPQNQGRHYAEWKAEQEGRPTIRSMIRSDIDSLIAEAYTFQSFLMLLEKRGYAVKNGPKRKYTAVKPPGSQRFIRLDSLGEGYTEAAIRARLSKQRMDWRAPGAATPTQLPEKYYRVRSKLPAQPKKKIKGFQALYLRYVYLLRSTRRRKRSHKAAFDRHKEVTKLKRYQEQFKYLSFKEITTAEQLERQITLLEAAIAQLSQERQPLYTKRKQAKQEEAKRECTAEIDQYTAILREKRRELALCRRIQEDIPNVSQALGKPLAKGRENLKKEVKQYEHQWRNR